MSGLALAAFSIHVRYDVDSRRYKRIIYAFFFIMQRVVSSQRYRPSYWTSSLATP